MKFVLWGGFGLGLLASLLGVLAPFFPYWELANHFRPFILLAAVLLALLGFMFGDGTIKKLLILLVLLNVMLLIPALLNRAGGMVGKSDQTSLKLMTYNIWVGNKKMDQVAQMILKESPDFIGLQEFTQSQFEILSPLLKKVYPYQYSCAHRKSCLLGLFSKRAAQTITFIDRNDPKFAIKGITLRGISRNPPVINAVFKGALKGRQKKNIHLMVTHISWPFHPHRQQADMAWLGQYVPRKSKRFVVMGDLNLSPWSWKLFRFQKQSALLRHTTFMHSWPANRLWPFVQLDHVLTSPDIKQVSTKTGGRAGSDHLSVISLVGLSD